MKLKYIFLLLASSFIVTGCFSSNYTVSDFKSKEDFNKKFNDFAKNKELNLTFENDSTIKAETPKISNDSMVFESNDSLKISLALSDIKGINYSLENYKNASISLMNGKTLKAFNIKAIPDSIKFTAVNDLTKINSVPLKNIKETSYKNRLLGIPPGIGWGIITVVALVIVIKPTTQGGNPPYPDDFDYGTILVGIPLAAILGAITGWFIGHNFNYHFN